MEILNWVLAIFLVGLAGYHYVTVRQLERRVINGLASVNDLSFRFGELAAFLENQIAKAHYDQLKRADRLVVREDTHIDEALSYPGAREILVKGKLIGKKDAGPFQESLAQRAGERNVPLEPLLAALNNLEPAP